MRFYDFIAQEERIFPDLDEIVGFRRSSANMAITNKILVLAISHWRYMASTCWWSWIQESMKAVFIILQIHYAAWFLLFPQSGIMCIQVASSCQWSQLKICILVGICLHYAVNELRNLSTFGTQVSFLLKYLWYTKISKRKMWCPSGYHLQHILSEPLWNSASLWLHKCLFPLALFVNIGTNQNQVYTLYR